MSPDSLQFLVELCCFSEANLTAVASRGLLVPILAELQSDDILGQLNCLELLASLAATCHGLEHLQSSGTVEQVQQFLDNTDSNPLMGLLMPGQRYRYVTIENTKYKLCINLQALSD